MKIIRNRFIPFKGFKAINLFGVLFVRKEAALTRAVINHEEIHTASNERAALCVLLLVVSGGMDCEAVPERKCVPQHIL